MGPAVEGNGFEGNCFFSPKFREMVLNDFE